MGSSCIDEYEKILLENQKSFLILGHFPIHPHPPPFIIRFWRFSTPLTIPTPLLLGAKEYFVKGTYL